MDKRLFKAILVDLLFLYPLIVCAGFLHWPVEAGITFLNVVVGILAFIYAAMFETFYGMLTEDMDNYSSFYWVYIVSTTIVELAVFAYLGWYGMAVMWIVLLTIMYKFLKEG